MSNASMSNSNMTIGKRIHLARQAAGYSQRDLARLLGNTQACISRWENDVVLPSLKHMQLLVKVLDISLADLLVEASADQLKKISLIQERSDVESIEIPVELWESISQQLVSLQQRCNALQWTVNNRPVKLQYRYWIRRGTTLTPQEYSLLDLTKQLNAQQMHQLLFIANALLSGLEGGVNGESTV